MYSDCVQAALFFSATADEHGYEPFEFYAQGQVPVHGVVPLVTPRRYPYSEFGYSVYKEFGTMGEVVWWCAIIRWNFFRRKCLFLLMRRGDVVDSCMILIVNLHNFPPAYLPERARRSYVPTDVASFYDLYDGVDGVLSRCMESATRPTELGWTSLGDEASMAGELLFWPFNR